MEVIDSGTEPGGDLVQVAFAETYMEAELVRGLLSDAEISSVSHPLNASGPVIFVRPEDGEAARTLLRETMVEEPAEEIPESANARYLAEAIPGAHGGGGRARNYSVLGAYARVYLVVFIVVGLVLLVFFALH